MKLTSEPKPVNFRIVLNNAEITSIESLRENFDFERLLVNDRMLFLRWLKRIDSEKEALIEETFTQSGNQLDSTTLIRILNIIYDPDPEFNDLVDVVSYLYEHDNIKNVKGNFSKYVSMHGDKLQEFFPIDRIPQGMAHLDSFFNSLEISQATASYLSRLHYQQGNIEQSLRTYPPLWNLGDRENTALRAIINGNNISTSTSSIIKSQTLSLIGSEFIFLCALGFMGNYPKNAFSKTLADLIDQSPRFTVQRNRIGGNLNRLVNAGHRKFYQACERLGYTKPQAADPLLNEKLFLSSIFADGTQHYALLSGIKDNYFPALFVLDSTRCESIILQSKAEVPFTWFNKILEYHENPSGLEGDTDKEDNDVNELAILAHQYDKHRAFMEKFFCQPSELNPSQGELYRRELIRRLQNGTGVSQPVRLKKREKEYLDLTQEVIYMCEHWPEYLDQRTGAFTDKCKELIEKYRKEGDPLHREKLFVVAILLLLKDHNKNRIYIEEKEIQNLKVSYIPMTALFRNNKISKNDKIILQLFNYNLELLHADWRTFYSPMDSLSYREGHYTKILKRWIANIVYYIE